MTVQIDTKEREAVLVGDATAGKPYGETPVFNGPFVD
jgi:hypothetical protein